MSLSVAVQMDDIQHIDISGDSTFALMLEAQKRGHQLSYYLPNSLSLLDGEVVASIQTIEVKDRAGDHYRLGELQSKNLTEFDTILMRQDPPFDMGYITATHMLERVHPQTLVVNNPKEVRNAPEKLFVIDYAEFMPPTLVTKDLDQIKSFRNTYKDIIIKPLYGNGGAGVFRLGEEDQNLHSLLEMFELSFPEPYMIQQYLPDVRAGDKRIILVDGEVAGAINRVPAEGESRSNMHVGGRPEPVDITPRDREICEAIGSELKARGFIFVGIDVIGDYMTEINVTSPTGIREVLKFGGADIASLIWDSIESKI